MSDTIREFLTAIVRMRSEAGHSLLARGYAYEGMEDFVLRHGEEFEPTPLPEGIERGEPRYCFTTAFEVAAAHGLEYVEGYAYNGTIPVHHAWNTRGDGRAIDATWDGLFDEPAVYLGVRFSLAFVLKTGRNGSVLDDWQRRWPILQQPWKEEPT